MGAARRERPATCVTTGGFFQKRCVNYRLAVVGFIGRYKGLCTQNVNSISRNNA